MQDTDLSNTNLSEANLKAVNFKNIKLTKSDLRGTRLDHALNITCEQIQSATIDQNTRLPDYILITGNPEKKYNCKNLMQGKGLNLKNVDLQKIHLVSADLQNADLKNADLSEAHFDNDNLKLANLQKTVLKKANLKTSINISCKQIQSAVIDRNTRLHDYIIITGDPETSYDCKNLMQGQPLNQNLFSLHSSKKITT